MQISCPNCRKNFEVDDSLIPQSGRLVQCGNDWLISAIGGWKDNFSDGTYTSYLNKFT